MVLFILALVWAIYLASWFRSRTEHRRVNSISSFNRHLSVLERTSPARHGISAVSRSPRPPSIHGPVRTADPVMTLTDARRRRRDVLYALTGGALVGLVLAVTLGGPFVVLCGLAVALLAGYVVALVRAQQLAQERRAKVRYLRQTDLAGDRPVDAGRDEYPAYLLSSSAR